MDKDLTTVDFAEMLEKKEVNIIDSSENINFIFSINNFNDNHMDRFNSSDTYAKKELMSIWSNDIRLEKLTNNIFENNLIFIDSKMPEMLSWMVLYSQITGKSKVLELIDLLMIYNPLKYNNCKIYEYKCKKLLSSLIIGNLPNGNWFGDSNNDGCIVARIGEMILVCDGRNMEGFEKYLFNHTSICTNFMDCNDYLKVLQENGQYYLGLNLQIKFQG